MADSAETWYYAAGDTQQGPVSEPELQRLRREGEIDDQDLVWCEGMPDWITVVEWEGGGAAAPHITTAAGATRATPPPRSKAARETAAKLMQGARQLTRSIGPIEPRNVLLVGLLLVLAARGCDSLGNRSVARTQALFEIAKAESLKGSAAKLQQDPFSEDAAQGGATGDGAEKLARLAAAAVSAEASRAAWAYWRQWLALLGAAAMAFSLLLLVNNAPPPERLACLVLLGILIWSLFVGGELWR